MIIPVIMAGGAGTRLWPLSRALYPKQLLPLADDNTMLQNTLKRLDPVQDMADPIVLCNEHHRFMVAEQLRRIGIHSAAIVLEPVARNTAPAIACAAIMAGRMDRDPILLVLPADHHMGDVADFHEALRSAACFAEHNFLVTFGVVPESPETGYGYIRRDDAPISIDASMNGTLRPGYRIAEFVEKPDAPTAEAYLASGRYYWNSGMFMLRAQTVLDELAVHMPGIIDACREAIDRGRPDMDFFRLEKEAFSTSPGISMDYAVMEKTKNGVVVPLDSGWNDLGSWDALWKIGKKDENENVIHGDVLIHDVGESYLHATSRLVAAVGLQRHIVIETADAVLISPRDRVQDVKALVDKLQRKNRREALSHRKDYRPWGAIDLIDEGEGFQIRRLTVNPGGIVAQQKHSHRAEHWIILKGAALITRGSEQITLRSNESTYIPPGVPHRLENPGAQPLEILEVRSGVYLNEDDILRMENVYGGKDASACPASKT